ncbi:hypothetical protein Dsin_030327 [Dipteronia sinensis]|uniref:Reverse transcriptase zinc-binding domain-containing protein n=1 Tax=Dipteronia sinensis TaxID=43782 RepID=A0AAD9ZJ57_9ROSI|nr:hypothetical protein Dsin_030327 [Dipteronia sinensis]
MGWLSQVLSGKWNIDLVRRYFLKEEAAAILSIPLSLHPMRAIFYLEITDSELQIPNKVKILCWKACREMIPTKLLMARRRIIESGCCSLFGDSPESVDHALWNGPVATKPRWTPPQGNVLKLNVDAAVDKSNCKIGMGIVVRNIFGDLVLAAGFVV